MKVGNLVIYRGMPIDRKGKPMLGIVIKSPDDFDTLSLPDRSWSKKCWTVFLFTYKRKIKCPAQYFEVVL